MAGWALALVIAACWTVNPRWPQWLWPIVALAFPAITIAMFSAPFWLAVTAWQSWHERKMSSADVCCAAMLGGEIFYTLSGGWP